MDDILSRIANRTRERIAKEEQEIPVEVLKEKIASMPSAPDFYKALKKDGMSFICEV